MKIEGLPWRDRMAKGVKLPPVTVREHLVSVRLRVAEQELAAARREAQELCAHHAISQPGNECLACGARHVPELWCGCGKARPRGLDVCWWCYYTEFPGDRVDRDETKGKRGEE